MPPRLKVISAPYWDPRIPTSENENKGVTAAPRKIFKAFEKLEQKGVFYRSWSGRSYQLAWDRAWENGRSDPDRIIETNLCNTYMINPLFLGGDHALTKKTLQQFKSLFGRDNLGLIYFDAHPDAKLSSSKLHARWMAESIKEGLVLRDRVLLLGCRAEEMGEESQFLVQNKIALMRAHDFCTNPREQWELALYNILAKWQKPLVHISIDIDVLDPSEAPGTLHRSSGGMRLAEHLLPALKVISQSGVKVVSMDLVEINPDLDPTENEIHPGITVNSTMTLIRELAALFGKE